MFISDPRTAVQSLGVRPVLAEGLNGSARVSFTLPAFRGRLLEIYRNELGLPASLKYLMGSMLYHCSALARLYAEECATFVEQYRLANVAEDKHSRENEKELAVHLEAPLYAVETMITKIIVG